MHDLAIITTSLNEAHWLRACLPTVLSSIDGLDVDIVIADIESEDDTGALPDEFVGVRTVRCGNRGFAHANNAALATCDARYVLFLNPDTEILEGCFADTLRKLDDRPDIGMLGVPQVTSDGQIYPTIRHVATPLRAWGEAFGSERLRIARRLFAQRELDLRTYEDERLCDWTIGSFMLVRRAALTSAGPMDERFFLYCEEEDFCLRIRNAGWNILHAPWMRIVHHVGKAGVDERRERQRAFAKRQYAEKNLDGLPRVSFLAAVCVKYAIRAVGSRSRSKRHAARRALRALVRREPPFLQPPITALPPSVGESSYERTTSHSAPF